MKRPAMERDMGKFIQIATAASLAFTAVGCHPQEIKIGIILGFTGPPASVTPAMGDAAEMAIKEVDDSGLLLGGASVTGVRGDSTCINDNAAVAVTKHQITVEGINGIVGGDCSGVTLAMLANAAMPHDMVMISPSATSPALSTAEDNGLFFRTAPSDARQAVVMTNVLTDIGIREVAVTYTDNAYGKGLADSFQAAFEAAGGTVTISAAHEDGKDDYSSEVDALAAAGGERLVVAGYVDQGGSGIVRAALNSGAFQSFHFPGGMVSDKLLENFGSKINGSSGQHPSPPEELAARFADLVGEAFDATSPYAPESYDAAALIMLAMQAAGSSDPANYKNAVLDVANAPGEKVRAGELAKALRLLADGLDIDYVGATDVELIGSGEAAGSYREVIFEGGKDITVGRR